MESIVALDEASLEVTVGAEMIPEGEAGLWSAAFLRMPLKLGAMVIDEWQRMVNVDLDWLWAMLNVQAKQVLNNCV